MGDPRPSYKSVRSRYDAAVRQIESLPDGAQVWVKAPRLPRICHPDALCGADWTALAPSADLATCRRCAAIATLEVARG